MAMRSRVPASVRRAAGGVPVDLAAVLVLTGLTVATVYLPVLRETLVRAAFATLFVLFVPGWAFVAALFPGDGGDDGNLVHAGGISLYERVALSFGTSIALVPLVGLVLNFTPPGIELDAVVVSLATLVVVLVSVAVRRRRRLAPAERFSPPWGTWAATAWSQLLDTRSRTGIVLTVVAILSVALAVGSVGYVALEPKQGAAFTEFYVLSENESGELTADDYPRNFTVGKARSLTVGIENHEHRTTDYTVLVELQGVSVRNDSTRVRETERIASFSPSVADGETWHRTHRVTPKITADRLRLTYLLYREGPPSDPSIENAYREAHLWVDVNGSGGNQ